MNQVTLFGNLTRDPELRFTPKGTAVAKIGLAVKRTFRAEGGSKEETAFIDCDVWGKQAETIQQYCKKGHSLLVNGRLKLDTWDDKQTGQKRSKLTVVVEQFYFTERPEKRTEQAQTDVPKQTELGDTPPQDGDDVPF